LWNASDSPCPGCETQYLVFEDGAGRRTIVAFVYGVTTRIFTRTIYNKAWLGANAWIEFNAGAIGLTGSYTGNGSGTTREINVGGSGEVVAIRCGDLDTMVLAMKNGGGLAKKGTTMKALSNSQVGFGDGKIIIMTADDVLNANGKTYKYQVL
jgi:hypothetical protein